MGPHPVDNQWIDWLTIADQKPLGFYAVQGEARQLQVCRKNTINDSYSPYKVVPHSYLSWFISPITRVYRGYIYS